MALWVKAPAVKPAGLTSIPETRTVEGETKCHELFTDFPHTSMENKDIQAYENLAK